MTNNVCLTGLGLSTGELVYINPDNTVSYAPKDQILTADYLEWKFVNNNGNNGLLQSTKTDQGCLINVRGTDQLKIVACTSTAARNGIWSLNNGSLTNTNGNVVLKFRF